MSSTGFDGDVDLPAEFDREKAKLLSSA